MASVIRWRSGTVSALGRQWVGACEVTVTVDSGSVDGDRTVTALAYPELVGQPVVGDRVLLNTTALDQNLGTGGYALVVALPERLPGDKPFDGHLVKARYTPLQVTVLGVDEPDSDHHVTLAEADSLASCPVVVADLHSALPAIVAGIRHEQPVARVAYVATDGGALPLGFSRTVAGLREADWLVGTVTVGQAFGGDLEAVTLHNGLLAARLVLAADVIVVAQGPGNLGTSTRWGFSGVVTGEAINAVAALDGRAVASLRVSAADARDRHRGVSHHSLTSYGRVALAAADVVVPRFGSSFDDLDTVIARQVQPLSVRHRLVEVDVVGLLAALAQSPVRLQSMGRDLSADQPSFLAAAAAGRHAAAMLRLST